MDVQSFFFGQPGAQTATSTPTHNKYKVSMCRDAANRSYCPRGSSCTFAHSEEELERYRSMPNANHATANGNLQYMSPMPSPIAMVPPNAVGIPLSPVMYPRYPPPLHHGDNYMPPMPAHRAPPPSPDYQQENHPHEGMQPANNFPGLMVPVADRAFYGQYGAVPLDEAQMPYRADFTPQVYQNPGGPYQGQEPIPMPNIFLPVQHDPRRNEEFNMPVEMMPEYQPVQYVTPQHERRLESPWAATTDVFSFDSMRNTLNQCSGSSDDVMFNVGERRVLGAERPQMPPAPEANQEDDQELEEELQALERRIDTEFKSD